MDPEEIIAHEKDGTLLLTVAEAARQLRVSRPTLYKMFRQGLLPKRRLLGRTLVARADLERLIASIAEAA
ncbi:helix-turn-helix domain-containing protein [Shinella pollutisoli]|uniref:Helix-turn-helix domain-containing protein n=1 Tax=Shinella pollutisoli TaxID=2250594 RepID=A0ABV7DGX1_9HYPH